MEPKSTAGISLTGSLMRYAEVERIGKSYRLLRLGSCDFEFAVADEIIKGPTSEDSLETLFDAVEDVFDGCVAGELVVVLPAPSCYSFFSPVPADAGEDIRHAIIRQETDLITGGPSELAVTAHPVRSSSADGQRTDWFHVTAIETTTRDRISDICDAIPDVSRRVITTTEGVAGLVRTLAERMPEARNSLSIGLYPSAVEYTVFADGDWIQSRFVEEIEGDAIAYFSASLLDRVSVRPDQLEAIFVYGDGDLRSIDHPMTRVFGHAPVPLNPLRLLSLVKDDVAGGDETTSYAPCLGAIL